MAERHVKMLHERQRLLAALRRSPNNADLHDIYANFLSREFRGDKTVMKEAIEHFELAIRHDPRLIEAMNRLSLLLKDRGRVDDAVKWLQRCLEVEPRYCRARRNLGLILERSGKLDDALAMYKEAVRLDPNDTSTWLCIGQLLRDSKGDHDDALRHFERAIAVDAHNSDAIHEIALDYVRRGVFPMARLLLQRSAELSPEAHRHHKMLATLLGEHMRCYDAAIREYFAALNCSAPVVEWRACKQQLEKLLSDTMRLPPSSAATILEALPEGPKPRQIRWSATCSIRDDPRVFETAARCSLGHRLVLMRRPKPYVGRATWSCNACAMAIGSSEAEQSGVLHCPIPCECDFCPHCHTRWRRMWIDSRFPTAADAVLAFVAAEAGGSCPVSQLELLAQGSGAVLVGWKQQPADPRRPGLGPCGYLPFVVVRDDDPDGSELRCEGPSPRVLAEPSSWVTLHDAMLQWQHLLCVGDIVYQQGWHESRVRLVMAKVAEAVARLHESGHIVGHLSLSTVLISPPAFLSSPSTPMDALQVELIHTTRHAETFDWISSATIGSRGTWLFRTAERISGREFYFFTSGDFPLRSQPTPLRSAMAEDVYALGLIFAALLTGSLPWNPRALLPVAASDFNPTSGGQTAKLEQATMFPHERDVIASFTNDEQAKVLTVCIMAAARTAPYDVNAMCSASSSAFTLLESCMTHSEGERPTCAALVEYFNGPTPADVETPEIFTERVALTYQGLKSRLSFEAAVAAVTSLTALVSTNWLNGVSLTTAWVTIGNHIGRSDADDPCHSTLLLSLRRLQSDRTADLGATQLLTVSKLDCFRRAVTEGTGAARLAELPESIGTGSTGNTATTTTTTATSTLEIDDDLDEAELACLPSAMMEHETSNDFHTPVPSLTALSMFPSEAKVGHFPNHQAVPRSALAYSDDEVVADYVARKGAAGTRASLPLDVQPHSRRAILALLRSVEQEAKARDSAISPPNAVSVHNITWASSSRIRLHLRVDQPVAVFMADIVSVVHESAAMLIAESLFTHLASMHRNDRVMRNVSAASIIVRGSASITSLHRGVARGVLRDASVDQLLDLAYPGADLPPPLAATWDRRSGLPPPPLELLGAGAFSATSKTDVYLAASLLLELVVGNRTGTGPATPLSSPSATDEPPVFAVPRFISKRMKEFLAMALHPDPSRRPSAAELLAHPWLAARRSGVFVFPEQFDDFEKRRSSFVATMAAAAARSSSNRGLFHSAGPSCGSPIAPAAAVGGGAAGHFEVEDVPERGRRDAIKADIAAFLSAFVAAFRESDVSVIDDSPSEPARSDALVTTATPPSAASFASPKLTLALQPPPAARRNPSDVVLVVDVDAIVNRFMAQQERDARDQQQIDIELIPWLLRSDALRKVVVHVEGFSDILFFSAVLSHFGLAPFRDRDSKPDDVRFFKPPGSGAGGGTAVEMRFVLNTSAGDPKQLVDTLSCYSSFDLSTKRFVYLRDNDLKAVTTEKANGVIVADVSDKTTSVAPWCLHQRMRWGRAIENYILPVEAPLAVWHRDRSLAFRFTLEAMSTLAKNFFPAPLSAAEWATTVGDGYMELGSASHVGRRTEEFVLRVAKHICKSNALWNISDGFASLYRAHKARPLPSVDPARLQELIASGRLDSEATAHAQAALAAINAILAPPAADGATDEADVRVSSKNATMLAPPLPALLSFLVPIAAAQFETSPSSGAASATSSKSKKSIGLFSTAAHFGPDSVPADLAIAARRVLAAAQEGLMVLSLGSVLGDDAAASLPFVLTPCPLRGDKRQALLAQFHAQASPRPLLDPYTPGGPPHPATFVKCLSCGRSLAEHNARFSEDAIPDTAIPLLATFGSYAWDSHPLFETLHGEGYLGKTMMGSHRDFAETIASQEQLTQSHIDAAMANFVAATTRLTAAGDGREPTALPQLPQVAPCACCERIRVDVSAVVAGVSAPLLTGVARLQHHRRVELEQLAGRVLPLFDVNLPPAPPLVVAPGGGVGGGAEAAKGGKAAKKGAQPTKKSGEGPQ